MILQTSPFVQHHVCTTPFLYNTPLVQLSWLQHPQYTTPKFTQLPKYTTPFVKLSSLRLPKYTTSLFNTTTSHPYIYFILFDVLGCFGAVGKRPYHQGL